MNSRDDRLRQMNSTSEEDFHAFFASSDKRIKFHARARKKYTAKGKGDEYLSFKKGTLLAVLAEDTEAGLYFGRLVYDENCIMKTGNASSGEGSDSCNEALATGWFPMGHVVKIKDEEMQRLIRHRQKKKTKEREKEKEKEREKEKEKEREKEREKEKEEKKENEKEKEKEKVRSMSLPTEPKTPKSATPPSSGRSSSLSSSSKSPRSDDESDKLYSPKSEDSVTPRSKMGSWKRLSGNFIPNKKLKANVDASKKDVAGQDNDSGGAVSNNPDGGDTKPDTENQQETSAPEPAKSFLGRGVFGSLRRRGSSTNVLEQSGSEGTAATGPSPRSPGGNKEEDKRQRRKSLGTLMKLGGSTILSSSSSSSTSNLTASTPGSSSSSFSALPSLKSISEREKQATPVAGSKKPAPRPLIKRKSADSGITTKSSDYWASPSANRAEIRRLGSQEDPAKKVCISEQDKETTTKGSPKIKERGEKEMKKKPPPPMKAAHSAPNLEHLIAQMRKKKEAEAEEKKNRQRSNSDGGPIEQEEAVIDQKEVSARKLKQRGKDGEKKKKKGSGRSKRKPLLEKEGKKKREKETGPKFKKGELDSSQEKEMEKEMDGDPMETNSNRLDEDLDVEIIDILRKERAQKRKKKKKKDRKELGGSGGSKKRPVEEEPLQAEDAEEKELPQQQQHQQHSSSLSSSTTTSRGNSKEVDSLQNILEELAGWEEENHLPTGPAYSYYQPEKELAKVPEEIDPSVGDITVEELIQSMKQFPSPPLRDSVLVNTEDVVIEEEFERVRSDSTREPGLTERFVSEDGSGRRSQSGPLVRTKQSVTLPPKSNSAANMPPVDLKAVKLRKIEVAKKDVAVEDPALVELRKKAEDEALRRNKHLEKLSRRAVNKGN